MTGRTASAAKGHITARFPTFAEHGRKALAAANAPKGAAPALDSSADKDVHASGESANLERAHPADAKEEPLVAAKQPTRDAESTDAGSARESGMESDASSSSNDARLKSPAKRTKQIFPE